MEKKTLEVDLGDEPIHVVQAIRKFEGRRIRVTDSEHGTLEGINMGYNRRGFYSISDHGKPQVLKPGSLRSMTLLEIREGDEMRNSHSYFEVTDRTIAMTKKWADKGYRA